MMKGAEGVEGVEAKLYRVPETLSKEVVEQMKAPAKDSEIPEAELAEADGFLFGFPTSKDNAFKTHPMNMLNERTLKGTFFGNYKPKTDIPGVVEKYMNKDMELEKFIAHISEINKAFDYMLKGESIRFIITMGA
ncbi:Flavoprotein-like domain protein [Raphanus sativus]|nr:Flavoprotein-like domain protein [Raphanus sativus]